MRLQYIFCILLITTVFLPFSAAAEEASKHGDFRYLLEPNRSYSTLSYMHEPKMEEDGGPGEYSLNKFEADISKAFELTEDADLLFGGTYGARVYSFEEVPEAITSTGGETLHEVSFLVGIEYFLSDSIYMQGYARDGLYTDFNGDLDLDDFNLEGQGLIAFRINPGTALILGAEYSHRFVDFDFFPIVGLRILSSSGGMHINLTLPTEAEVTFNLSSDFSIYAGAWIDGDRYNVRFGSATDDFDVNIQENRIGGGMYYWLGQHVRLGVEGGALIGSKFEFEPTNAGQFKDDLETGPYISASLGLSF